ncbi:MAG: hypothetical protein LKJ76_08775 [Lachnospiraceae bacterium]|jgi:leader peptidase (prepilin peptidase)/N-methyltransferase|nr:hypothetical protein [Lachnospiraceae bacterium]
MRLLTVRYLLCGVFLTIAAVQDIRHREIKVFLPIVFSAVGASLDLYGIAHGDLIAYELVLAVLPGLFLVLAAFAARGSVGLGDGYALAAAGLLIGERAAFLTLCLSVLAAALAGIVMMAAGKAGKETKLPFLPFCLAGYTAAICIMALG